MNRPDGARVRNQCYWVVLGTIKGILSFAETPNTPSVRSGKYILPSGYLHMPGASRRLLQVSEGP